MLLIDRYILGRFLTNFAILFGLLYVFATSIDLILNLDKFVDAARREVGDDAGSLPVLVTLLRLVVDFQAPRFFQFYGYLHGLVVIGAMAFTLAQMHHFRELVAVLASGMSLHRIAMPFIAGTFVICILQLVNQEFFLPRVAPLLLRDHANIGRSGFDAFEIQFTSDGKGNLLLAPRFDPNTNTLTAPTFLERENLMTTSRRISADEARWDESRRGWVLTNGLAIVVSSTQMPNDNVVQRTPLEFYASDISPDTLIVRRYAQFAGMLSLRQIDQMLKSPHAAETSSLIRYRFSRFSTVLVNILVLVITLPSFLLREPSNLLRQSVICAAIAIPCMFGAVLGMMVELPGIPPVAGVFIPVFILIPVALGRVTFIRT